MELLTEDYIITSQKSLAISITVGYDSATHLLVKMEFSGASAAQIEYFGNYIPATLEKLPKLAERLSWNVRPVDMNLDFENFYELYGNKVGKKEAQNRWKRMTKSEKVKAIHFFLLGVFRISDLKTIVAKE